MLSGGSRSRLVLPVRVKNSSSSVSRVEREDDAASPRCGWQSPAGVGTGTVARPPSSAGPEVGPDGLGLTAGRTLPSPGNLWYRQGVVPSYPQGSGWEHVSNNVRRVSVGPLDQVWGRGRGTGVGEGRFPPVSPLPSPWCHRRAPGLQPARVPGLGHRQQSPGEPQSEQGDRVSPNRRAAAGAQGSGLGLRHRGEQAGGARPRHAPCSGPTGGGLAWGWREARTESLGGP